MDKRTIRRWVRCSALLTLAACAGSSSKDAPVAGQDAKGRMIGAITLAVQSELPVCNAGHAANVYYVSSEQQLYFCDGRTNRKLNLTSPQPQNGINSLVTLKPASASQCAAGGALIQVGLDANRNGALDPGEVAGEAAVCNGRDGTSCSVADNGNGTKTVACTDGTSAVVSDGKDGADGVNGANGNSGHNSLVSLTDEPAGAGCAQGGKRLDVGIDNGDNGGIADNGLLESGEIDATTFVCSTVVVADAAAPDAAQEPDAGQEPPADDGATTPDAGTGNPSEAGPGPCGDGVRNDGEQCDDGNLTNLDGCDSTCAFEQDLRVNWLKMQFRTDSVCTRNAFGGAIGSGAQTQLQTALDNGIADGSVNILMRLLDLSDLSGTNDPTVQLGVLTGSPAARTGYSGVADLDGWYLADPLSLDDARLPTDKLSGAIRSKVLTAGPSAATVALTFGGQPVALRLSDLTVRTTINAVSAPLASTNGSSPGHLPSEQLDPTLTSFASAGQQNASGAGTLCGEISAASLASVPIPQAVLDSCTAYTMTNSILDLIVGGCSTLSGFVQVITPTQPDSVDASLPAAGAGGPYHLSAGANRMVNICKDTNNTTVPLGACLAAATYSSYFKFTTDRIIIK